MDYNIDEEQLIVTIAMRLREAQMPFTLTLTPTTVDDVLSDTRLIATDYLGDSFSTLTEAGKATSGEKDLGTLLVVCMCQGCRQDSRRGVFRCALGTLAYAFTPDTHARIRVCRS